MKRPPKQVVEAAIRAGLSVPKGSMGKVAGILSCSRPALYRWCYQYGLDKLAGISSNNREPSYNQSMSSKPVVTPARKSVSSGAPERRTFPIVESTVIAGESKVSATAQVAESVWKRIKKLSIDRDCTPSQIVEEALVKHLNAAEHSDEAGK